MDGKSLWSKRIGESVISPMMTLRDAPHNREFSGATSFDGDGLPTVERDLIKNGVLLTHLHDCYTAKRCGAVSTATSGGPFALMMATGNGELKSMQNARQDLLVVDRFSGNIDPIKGDFSGVAKSSRYLKNGEDQGAVSETMIAGNLFESLSQILSVSSVFEDVGGSMRTPWVLIDGVSVS